MNRIERAKAIHEAVLKVADATGSYDHRKHHKPLMAHGTGWTARIHTQHNPYRGAQWPPLMVVPLPEGHFRGRNWLPNRMGLWLDEGPKVLTVEWLNEQFILVSMRRGDWESKFFGLPPYEGSAGLRSYELKRPRNRRW